MAPLTPNFSQTAALQDPQKLAFCSRKQEEKWQEENPPDTPRPCGTYLEQHFSSPPWHDPEAANVGGHVPARQKFPWLLHAAVSAKGASAEPVGRGGC